MIKSYREYLNSLKILKESKDFIKKFISKLRLEGYNNKEIKFVLEPIISFDLSIYDEIKEYRIVNNIKRK